MIYPVYGGQVFQIALTDHPEKRTSLVSGHYTQP